MSAKWMVGAVGLACVISACNGASDEDASTNGSAVIVGGGPESATLTTTTSTGGTGECTWTEDEVDIKTGNEDLDAQIRLVQPSGNVPTSCATNARQGLAGTLESKVVVGLNEGGILSIANRVHVHLDGADYDDLTESESIDLKTGVRIDPADIIFGDAIHVYHAACANAINAVAPSGRYSEGNLTRTCDSALYDEGMPRFLMTREGLQVDATYANAEGHIRYARVTVPWASIRSFMPKGRIRSVIDRL